MSAPAAMSHRSWLLPGLAALAVACSSSATGSAASDGGVTGGSGDGGDAGTSAGVDGGACGRGLPSCPSKPPSYATAVQPVLERRCVSCHYPSSTISGVDVSTYDAAKANRGSILNQVYGCAMPPADSPALTAQERTTVMTWLVCGAPAN